MAPWCGRPARAPINKGKSPAFTLLRGRTRSLQDAPRGSAPTWDVVKTTVVVKPGLAAGTSLTATDTTVPRKTVVYHQVVANNLVGSLVAGYPTMIASSLPSNTLTVKSNQRLMQSFKFRKRNWRIEVHVGAAHPREPQFATFYNLPYLRGSSRRLNVSASRFQLTP